MVERVVEERFRRLSETATSTDEATERVTEIFDTSQPTDSATGTPPLLSRTTEKRSARQTSEGRERTEAASTGHEEQTRTTASKLFREDAADSEAENLAALEAGRKEESHGGNSAALGIPFLVWAALLAVVAWAFVKHRLNKH